MSQLLLIPLEDIVVFPDMSVTLTVDVAEGERVLLVPVHEGEYADVGTVAEVTNVVRLPGGGQRRDALRPAPRHRRRGPHRRRRTPARRGRRAARRRRRLACRPPSSSVSTAPSSRRCSTCATPMPASSEFVRSITGAGALADTTGYAPDVSFAEKIDLLETIDVVERLELAVRLQRERLAELQVRRRIREDVESGAQKQQREYILRQQMDVDPQGARRGRRLGGRGVPHEDRRGRDAGAVREQAEREIDAPRAHGRRRTASRR